MKTLLLIDDDPLFRQSLSMIVRALGYEVVEAVNGNDGLRCFRQHAVDLVVLDLIMPEKEGIETIKELRQLSPHMKIVAVSGGGRGSATDYLAIASLFGADAVLSKPFGCSEIAAVLERLLPQT